MPVPRRRTRLSSRAARKTEVFSGPDKRSSPGSAKTAEGRLRAIGIERGQPVGWCRHLSRRQIGNAQRTYKGLAPNPRRRPRNLHTADCAFLSFVGGTVRKNGGQGTHLACNERLYGVRLTPNNSARKRLAPPANRLLKKAWGEAGAKAISHGACRRQWWHCKTCLGRCQR